MSMTDHQRLGMTRRALRNQANRKLEQQIRMQKAFAATTVAEKIREREKIGKLLRKLPLEKLREIRETLQKL